MCILSETLDSVQMYGAKYVNNRLGKSNEISNYSKKGHHFKYINSNLLFDLSNKHTRQLNNRKGQELGSNNNNDSNDKPAPLQSVFSSSALAINAFSHLDQDDHSLSLYDDVFESVDFEKPLMTLKGITSFNDVYAYLDVFLEGEKTIIFVESKYSEPYYTKTHKPVNDSYKTKRDKYQYELYDIDKWAPFIESMEKDFSDFRFDLQQNLKHLIGIHNFLKENPKYRNYKIILLNLIYDVKESFGDKKLTDKLNQVISEFNEVKKPINEFMTSKPINLNFKIDYMTYSDFIDNHLQDQNVKDYLLYKYYNY